MSCLMNVRYESFLPVLLIKYKNTGATQIVLFFGPWWLVYVVIFVSFWTIKMVIFINLIIGIQSQGECDKWYSICAVIGQFNGAST